MRRTPFLLAIFVVLVGTVVAVSTTSNLAEAGGGDRHDRGDDCDDRSWWGWSQDHHGGGWNGGGGNGGGPTEECPDPDIALVALGHSWQRGGGRATADLGDDTQLTIVSGSLHSNGDLRAGEVSSVVSDGSVTAKRWLLCDGLWDTSCFPEQAGWGGYESDPLDDVRGSFPWLGHSQHWPACDDVCTVEPGTYKGPITVPEGVEYVLEPGYYRFSKGDVVINGTLRAADDAEPHDETGAGITLMFDKRASLEIGVTGGLSFDASEAGPYAGVAVYYHRWSRQDLVWRAANNDLTGWVYAKNGHLRFESGDWTTTNRFVVRSFSAGEGSFTIDPNGTDEPFVPVPDVVPIFECHIEHLNGTYSAYFGYDNRTVGENGDLIATDVPLGELNVLEPADLDGTQPASFQAGRTAPEDAEPNAFAIDGWDGSPITWTLLGATATADLATNCSSQPDLPALCFGVRSTIEGTDEDEVIIGTEGDDIIHAGAGNDVVDGLGGNDLICGGEGEDVLNGDGGDDRLDGEAGHDVVDGGVGFDELLGGSGDDALFGGADDDSLEGGDGDDVLHGDAGDDSLSDATEPLDSTRNDRDVLDGGEGVNACDGDLDDVEVSC